MSQSTEPPRFVTLPEIRRAAKARLPREAWNFGDGGAETERTLRRNRRHLDRLAIQQNVLVDVRAIDLRTSLLGVPLSWPVAVAPMGGLVLFHAEGDVEMEVDDSTIKLKAGDVLVQRGTLHAWINRGSEPARIAFILIDAKPLGIGNPVTGEATVR